MSNGYELCEGTTVRLPNLADSAKLKEASEDALRVLICLSLSDYAASVNELADRTGLTLTRTAAAVEYWLEAQVLRASQAAPKTTARRLVSDELPKGSAADDARVIAQKKLQGFLDTCAQILDKLLNPAEINILVAILQELDVSEAYVITLLDFCVNTLDRRGVKYLEKTATSLCDRGIRDIAALDEYIKRHELIHSHEGEIRRLYGMGARALTERERTIIARWFSEYGYDMEVIGAAYDITANTAEKVTLAYTDKILANWHAQGLKTLPEIETYLAVAQKTRAMQKQSGRKSPQHTKPSTVSFDVDSFFESALQRSYGTSDNKK